MCVGHLYFFIGKKVYSRPLPIFKLGHWFFFFFFDAELCEFFIYFGYEPFNKYIIGKYLQPFGRLPLSFMVSLAMKSFSVCCCPTGLFLLLFSAKGTDPEKILLRLMSRNIRLMFSSRNVMVLG